jgi:hypothetical protein
MFETNGKIELCNICKKEFTSIHIEALPGFKLYVCKDCVEDSKHNFIWICLKCGKTYIRPKELINQRINGYRPKNLSIFTDEVQIIQGLEMCIKCNPEGILLYVYNKGKSIKEHNIVY